MKRILGSLVVVLALGMTATLFADEDLPGKIDVVIVEPSSSSVASSNSAASSNSTSPKSSSSAVAESGSSQGGSSQSGEVVDPGSSAGTAAIMRVDAPSAVPQGDKWFDTKGRRLEKKPAAAGSYVNNGRMQTVK
jgi:hypothetical protein